MDDQSGGQVDQQLKQLMNELGAAINESLADSEQIAEVVSRIKDGGYDIFLVLEATIGVSKQSDKSTEKTSLVTTLSSNADLKISEQDLKFLKSLRIKLDEEEKEALTQVGKFEGVVFSTNPSQPKPASDLGFTHALQPFATSLN